MKYATVKGYFGCLIGLGLLFATPLAAKSIRIYVANYEGTTIDGIDLGTRTVVQVIEGIPKPHGIKGSPDGRRLYVSSEVEQTLDVVDQETGQIIKKILLSGRPNNIAITKDGKRVMVCININSSGQGALDIVDTTSLEKVTTIPMGRGMHNVFLSEDGKYAVATVEQAHSVNVIDLQTEKPLWDVKFEVSTQVLALESGPGGSISRIFVQLHEFHGFAVVDFATHQEVARIRLPDDPRGFEAEGYPGVPSHGIGVNPDGKTLWVNSGTTRCVFVYSLPDLKLLGNVRTGVQPQWLSFSPSGDMVYVSNNADDKTDGTVSLIDTKTMKEVARVPVGKRPLRTAGLVLP
jgi:YVTN family beta-propeller protein